MLDKLTAVAYQNAYLGHSWHAAKGSFYRASLEGGMAALRSSQIGLTTDGHRYQETGCPLSLDN